ncbi:MAG TPA: UvrD-helicase domain-containing protein [Ktedonobacteraceae bacterium]|nr:UvrD-helicase domain-containing protein [Ktedonobacteraceae bacterium]
MPTEWRITQKPDFFKALVALPPKEMHQIMEKINLLAQDPTPDAKVKKQLKYLNGRLHRIRSGDYRIFYTFEQPYISILALRRRDDDTYDEDMDVEFLGGLDPQFDEAQTNKGAQPDWERILAPKAPQKKPLPEPITEELLANLKIPEPCHTRLLLIQTQEDLLDCPGVPIDYLLQINEYMFERPLVEVLQQPDYLLNDVNDLLRYKEGELLGFLLKLSPEQEKYVTWGMKGSGPTLLKGGPGTGKSTIALYRVRSLVHELRKKGRDEFRILFTTYTNALVNSSKQLLQQLLGDDVKYVEVQTADSIVMSLLGRAGVAPKFIDAGEFNNLLRQAVKIAQFDGNAVQQQAQRQAVERLSIDYLHQEINQVIVARQVSSLEDYLAASRPGRKVRLNALQRKAVWKVHETLRQLLKQQGKETWHQARALAEECVTKGKVGLTYDAVVIDEAQDLDPSALRLLVRLCNKPNRIFITADANQSIYGSGFTWSDVHEHLKLQGRTSILRVNYRSTREIGEAAQSYLSVGELDNEQVERTYMNSGPMPAVRVIRSGGEEVQLLSRFLPAAAKEFRLAIGACAVLCPTAKAGKAIAAELTQRGVEATFMPGQELNLSRPGVKVLTLNSAKGLEFPIVALSGFINSGWYGNGPANVGTEEREEFLATDRRTMFVGMTRAMRALLVVVPVQTKSPLLEGFDGAYWNLGD